MQKRKGVETPLSFLLLEHLVSDSAQKYDLYEIVHVVAAEEVGGIDVEHDKLI